MTIGYSMTVKEMKELLKDKKDNEILDFDIYVGYYDEVEMSVFCRNLDTKKEKHIIEMSDGMVHLYK